MLLYWKCSLDKLITLLWLCLCSSSRWKRPSLPWAHRSMWGGYRSRWCDSDSTWSGSHHCYSLVTTTTKTETKTDIILHIVIIIVKILSHLDDVDSLFDHVWNHHESNSIFYKNKKHGQDVTPYYSLCVEKFKYTQRGSWVACDTTVYDVIMFILFTCIYDFNELSCRKKHSSTWSQKLRWMKS